MLRDVLISALRLPLLFRGDVMRESSITVLAVTTPLLLLILALKMRSGMRLSVAFLWAILGIYTSWAAGLLFGEPLATTTELAGGLGHWVNLIPFATIGEQARSGAGSALVQLIGNVGLLLPLGLFGPALMPSLRHVHRLALVGLGASAAIELVQLIATIVRFIDRSVDIDDVILNVAGALLGWLLWRAFAAVRDLGRRSVAIEGQRS